MEDVFMATNPRSALKLGQARGAAVVAAMQNGLAVHDYSAKNVKRAVVGYGQAEKGRCSIWSRSCWVCRSPSADAADALAVAICHAHQFLLTLLFVFPEKHEYKMIATLQEMC